MGFSNPHAKRLHHSEWNTHLEAAVFFNPYKLAATFWRVLEADVMIGNIAGIMIVVQRMYWMGEKLVSWTLHIGGEIFCCGKCYRGDAYVNHTGKVWYYFILIYLAGTSGVSVTALVLGKRIILSCYGRTAGFVEKTGGKQGVRVWVAVVSIDPSSAVRCACI
jgi:hypothetical protein